MGQAKRRPTMIHPTNCAVVGRRLTLELTCLTQRCQAAKDGLEDDRRQKYFMAGRL